SWTDWMSLPPLKALPQRLSVVKSGKDTLEGKYSPCVIWDKKDDRVNVDVNVLACEEGRRWCPTFKVFFEKGIDFDSFKMSFKYDNVLGYDLSPADITGYSYQIDSNGRGHEMQRILPRNKGPFFVSTQGEVYILDREFLTRKEAKVWEDYRFDEEDVGIFEPSDAPPLNPEILALIKRVEEVDKGSVRLSLPPDERLVSIFWGKRKMNLGERALALFKQLTGITLYKSNKNAKSNWKKFKEAQIRKNKERNLGGE
ncbi:MAG: hypothetical protein K2G23_07715, partial [Muribaculaceae bacterium]|nr:hypothetical protein [Muribaculaceae bacterium]